MSDSEYMKNVKWATAIYSAVSCGSVLIAMCGMYWGLKGDIKDSQVTETIHYIGTNHKIDSLNNQRSQDAIQIKNDISDLKEDISDIWAHIQSIKPNSLRRQSGTATMVTAHRDENNNVTYRPYRNKNR